MTMPLRVLRRQSGMTLGTLAARAGLTESYLSKLERGLKTPSIATAIRLAEALGVDVETLFDAGQPADLVTIVRADERTHVGAPQIGGHSPYEGIATKLAGKEMLPFLLHPTESDDPSFREHPGEEFVFVHSGSVLFQFADSETKLSVGDSAYFHGVIPHRLRPFGKSPPAVLVVISHSGALNSAPPRH